MKKIKDLIKRTLNANRGFYIVLLIFVATCVGLLCLMIGDIKRHDIAHTIIDGILLWRSICAIKEFVS